MHPVHNSGADDRPLRQWPGIEGDLGRGADVRLTCARQGDSALVMRSCWIEGDGQGLKMASSGANHHHAGTSDREYWTGAYSEGIRPGIPTESGHHSERSRPPIPTGKRPLLGLSSERWPEWLGIRISLMGGRSRYQDPLFLPIETIHSFHTAGVDPRSLPASRAKS